jgi:hypothetical protein
MTRPNLRQFLTAVLSLLAATSAARAQHFHGGPGPMPAEHVMYQSGVPHQPMYSSAPIVEHYIGGDPDAWNESRPIERFLSETAQQSWLRLEFMVWDYGDLGNDFIGAPVTGLVNGALPNQVQGRDITVPYSDNLNGGASIGDALIPTTNGMDLNSILGLRGTWGLHLDGAEMEWSFFGFEDVTTLSDFGSIAAARLAYERGRTSGDPALAALPQIDPTLGASASPTSNTVALPGTRPWSPNYFIPLLTDGAVQDVQSANALVFNDRLTVGASSQVWGSELAFLSNRRAPGGVGPSLQWLGGLRYINLEEAFWLTGSYGTTAGPTSIIATRNTAINSTTMNHIYGPEFGARLALTSKYLTLSATPRVMFGLNNYTGEVAADPTGLAVTHTGDESVEFSTATQLNLLAEMHFNRHFSVYGGYDFMVITGISRPHENVYYNSVLNLVGGTTDVDIRQRTNIDDYFFANGVSFGLKVQY